MSPHAITLQGLGAVSPAGWGVPALREAIRQEQPPPTAEWERPGWDRGLPVRKVPPPPARPSFLAHPRLRRASSISHYTVAAALEALGDAYSSKAAAGLGIIFCTMAGPLNYSRRFYGEALRDPATASPMLFPETVLNAPASHLAALLGATGPVYTLISDDTAPLSGLALAAHWLQAGRVERCLVVAAEELDWLAADAFRLFLRGHVAAEGAGALLLGRGQPEAAVQLAAVTDPIPYSRPGGFHAAVLGMRAQLKTFDHPQGLLCDSQMGLARRDRAEAEAWRDWPGRRCSPRSLLGNALTAATAWQAVLAAGAVAAGDTPAAVLSAAGCNHQAVGAAWTARR